VALKLICFLQLYFAQDPTAILKVHLRFTSRQNENSYYEKGT